MRVSVLLPAFDAGRTLKAALDSVRRQSFTDFECVVVDDGSRDDTARLARAVAREDPRLVVLEQAHRGIVEALETGLARCSGEYVARMDADDVMHPERLATQLALLDARDDLAAVGSHVRMFPREELTLGRLAYERWLNSMSSERDVRADCFVECPVAHPTLMLRRSVLERFGYRDAGWAEDYDLVLRLLGAGHEIGVAPQRLLDWRDAPDRLSRTSRACSLERFTACKAEFLTRSFLAEHSEYVLWGYGDTGRVLCRALAALGRRPRAIVELHPGRLGQRIAGAPVIAPEALPDLARGRVVVSVAGAKARGEIRSAMAAMGFVELTDYVCAA